MKRKTALFFLFFAHIVCYAKSNEETFLRANRCYQKREYQKAFDFYDSINKKGPATLYNMGNCAFKLNNHVDALVFWRKAKRNATQKELQNIQTNIAVVGQVLGRSQNGTWITRLFEYIFSLFSLFAFQFLFLCAWLLLFISVWLFRRKKVFLISLLLPINVFFGLLIFMKHNMIVQPYAVVTKPKTSLFSGPDQDYHVVGAVNCADEVRVVETRDQWCKVKAGSLAGWILADRIEVV